MFKPTTLSAICIKINALARPARCAVVTALIFGLTVTSSAVAQIYTWTDSQGRTHFSQTPPDTETSTSSTPELVAPGHLPRMAPRLHNGDVYCGREKLPSQTSDTEYHLVSLARLRLREEPDAAAGKDRSRCILHWISTEMERHQKTLSMLQNEYKTLLTQYQTLAVGVDRKCSPRAGGWIVGSEAQAWMDCHVPTSKRAKIMEKRLLHLKPLIPADIPQE